MTTAPSRRWRWRRTLAWLYLVLLAASFFVQAPGAGSRDGPRGRSFVEIPAIGARTGRPVRIAYIEQGEGEEVVVLIHGSPGAAGNFGRLQPHLARTHRVIAVDLPGFGGSSRRVQDYGIEAHGRSVLAMMDALDIERAHVIGFSMGTGPALHMAALAPHRVRSLTFLAGIGLQEAEGSGDYHFEHLKYALGYVAMVIAPELVPHFGLLGDRGARHAFIRNFMDTDQRPLEAILRSTTQPVLILHGEHDVLVPAWAARAHHDLIEHSELVVYDSGHFMPFDRHAAQTLAEEILPFLDRAARGVRERRTVDPFPPAPAAETRLFGFDLRRGMSPWAQMGVIVVGTYILEDPTTIATGLLVRRGRLDLFVGLIAIFVGIYSGDLGLYLLGWLLGRRVLRWPPLARRLPAHRLDALGTWLDTRGWSAVLASRFIPGTRLPLYVSAGALGRRPVRFAVWTCLAVMIWAPVMLIMVLVLGEAAVSPFRLLFGDSVLAVVAAVVLLLILLRNAPLLFSAPGRVRLRARLARIRQWEFWPPWLFYLPLVPWIAWLALRHRGLGTITVANPGIPHGGIVGESKFDILARLPQDLIIPSARIDGDSFETRRSRLDELMTTRGWAYPIVLKPDAGERGAGVKLIRTPAAAHDYLEQTEEPVLAQHYHPGPCEAGIFFIREPGAERGRIFSITDKAFPELVGDGRSTVEELIWRHARYRMQARTFLTRHADRADTVLAPDERLPLTIAGNHCQGTLFLDGSRLHTPALEAEIDRIAAGFEGFHFGRFDVRYADEDRLKAGGAFAIIELNGATSESTNIYDPRRGLLAAYRTLYRQWQVLFEIGARNRARGFAPTRTRDLVALVCRHYRHRSIEAVSD